MSKPVCEKCGAPSRVHVSNQLPGVGKVMRHFCLTCADAAQEDVLPTRPPLPPLSRAAVYLATGVFVLLVSLTVDWVRPGEKEGFGAYQWAALIISIVLFLAAAVARTISILVVASLMILLTVFADWLKLGSGKGSQGFGVYQTTGCALGVLLLIYGGWLSRRQRARA